MIHHSKFQPCPHSTHSSTCWATYIIACGHGCVKLLRVSCEITETPTLSQKFHAVDDSADSVPSHGIRLSYTFVNDNCFGDGQNHDER